MKLTNMPDLWHVSTEGHEALLARGYRWQPCCCDRGQVRRLHGIIRCRECYGDGGTYVLDAANEAKLQELWRKRTCEAASGVLPSGG